MAAITLTDPVADGEVPEMLSKLQTDFRFLLEAAEVPQALLAKLASLEVTSTEVFSKLVSSEAELKDLLRTDVGFNPTGSIPNSVACAKLCSAWETAGIRGRKRKDEEAHQMVGDLPRKLPKSDHYELRKLFAARHREMEDRHLPHPE